MQVVLGPTQERLALECQHQARPRLANIPKQAQPAAHPTTKAISDFETDRGTIGNLAQQTSMKKKAIPSRTPRIKQT